MQAFVDDIVRFLQQHVPFAETALRQAIEVPPSVQLGDYAFPCFPLAKVRRKAPAAIAAELASVFQPTVLVREARATGPYLNFFVDRVAYSQVGLAAIAEQGPNYGSSQEGRGKTVVIDYSSPNIAKPFGVGHLRTTVIGQALYLIYSLLGYSVVRINHLGDWGTQFGKLIVAFRRWGDEAALATNAIQTLYELYVRFHAEVETQPGLEEEARTWFKRLEDGDSEARALWQRFRDLSLEEFARIYDRLGIDFDSYAGESFYEPYLESTIERIREAGLVSVSEDALIVDLRPYNMPPCLLRKKDEATLYATRDLAAAMYRHDTYHPWKMLYVVGADQRLHFQQVFKVLELMGFAWAKDCVHVDFGLIKFNAEKMGTRRGNIIFLEDVLDRAVELAEQIVHEKNPALPNKREVAEMVGIGAVIFAFLSTRRVKDVNFEWEKVLTFEGETGPYVQYTHARACSVLRKADEEVQADVDCAPLAEDEAFALIRRLVDYPAVLRRAAQDYEPFLVTDYLLTLSEAFNKYYHNYRILTDDPQVRHARLLLVKGVQTVIQSGLRMLGIKAPEEM
ncbi:MAG TPA: arginine--tRNA ligase [Alphaproteobacteria bacterium]|nr:arginine--tRNA ligase [Alphaproteobacteria bacterium]